MQLKDIQNEISGYRVFDEAVTLFRAYCSLPSDVLRKAASIIRPESADLFFAMGCQKDNVLALWDFMKSEWERLGESETKILLETLTYFLKMINSINGLYFNGWTAMSEIHLMISCTSARRTAADIPVRYGRFVYRGS